MIGKERMMTSNANGWVRSLWAQPYVLLALTTLFWAGNAVAGRAAVGEVSPFVLVMLRWAIVAAFILIVARKDLAAAWPTLKARIGYIVVMGIIGFTAFNSIFYVAAHHTTALNIGIIQGSMPVFVLIGAFLAFGTRITMLQAGGVLVTMAGVVVVASKGDLARLVGLAFNHGDLLMLIAATFYASYAVFLREKPAVAGLAFFGSLAIAAFVASLPLVAVEAASGDAQWPTPLGWAIVAYVALFPSFLAQIFFIRGVELIGAGRAGVFINLVPVFAPLLAVLILGEAFRLYHVAALALVLSGIWLAERGKMA